MRVSILLAIILANAVISVNPVTGDVYVAQGGMGGNVNLSSGLVSGSAMNGFLSGSGMNGLVSSSGLNGLSVNANGLILNGQGLALGDGGNERIVSNQRLAIKPRYITERVNRKPRFVTETVVTPVYENVVNQPRVERTRVELNPSFQRQADVLRNNRRVEEAQNTEATRVQTVDVAGDIVETRPITRPALLVRRENVRFAPSEAQSQNEAPITLPTRNTSATVQRNANRPGDLTNNRLVIQPTFEKTNVNVQLQRAQDRVMNHPARTLPLDSRTRTRVERVNVAGDQLYNQRIFRPAVTREEVAVRFVPSQAVTETRDAIMRPTIRSKEVRRKFYNLEYKVPVERTVRVRVPNYVKVNDYRTVHVPVDEEGNEINVSQGGYKVLGGAALDNEALARVQGSWNLSGANELSGDASAEFASAYNGDAGVSVDDVLNADDTLAEAALENGQDQFAAGLEAGAELLSAASAQNALNQQASGAFTNSMRFGLMNYGMMGGNLLIGRQ